MSSSANTRMILVHLEQWFISF